MDGLPDELMAHSKFNNVEDFVKFQADPSLRMYLTEYSDNYQRALDAEAKILEEISLLLGNNFKAHGTINLYTENYPCVSCYGVIEQFKTRYPYVTLEVFYGDGYWAKEFSSQFSE
nr:deaminase domain-containing protein [Brevibacillus dissolubilis]